MSWWRRFIREPAEERQAELEAVQAKFGSFTGLLEGNKRVLKIVADMEEKSQGEHLFDINYIRSSRAAVREGVADVVDIPGIKKGYYGGQANVNPTGIVPVGPDIDLTVPHNRGSVAKAA